MESAVKVTHHWTQQLHCFQDAAGTTKTSPNPGIAVPRQRRTGRCTSSGIVGGTASEKRKKGKAMVGAGLVVGQASVWFI